jgi:phosphoenolpyruvate synthase/pyruvate phosphate dikinase
MEVSDPSTAYLGFGGKGNSLKWLAGHGYPCPRFDLLDANCWRGLLTEDVIQGAMRTVSYGVDDFSFRLACLTVREAIEGAPLPASLDDWFASEPLTRLGGSVAVRSSALSEDGSSTSSAGQYESILGLTNVAELECALRGVLASYFGERAVLYRRARGIRSRHGLEMGVIVQDLVEAQVCGIAFSVNPVTGRPGPVVEASWGLGPPLVSGEVEPDRFEFAAGAVEPTKVSIGQKQKTLSFNRRSGSLQSASDGASDDLCVSLEVVEKIAATVVEMEGRYGSSVDVEWAIASGRPNEVLYLQIRPVTGAALAGSTGLMTTY